MSQMLNALKRAQQKYNGEDKTVLTRTKTEGDEIPRANEPASGPSRKTKTAWFLWYTNVALYLVLAFSITMTILMNNRISSKVSLSNKQISLATAQLKRQEERIAQLNDTIQKMEITAKDQSQKVNSGFENLNGDVAKKIGFLKDDISNQKKTIVEIAVDAEANRKTLKNYQSEVKTLKEEMASLQKKFDAIINIPTP